MGKHRKVPPVAKPTGKQRLMEWGKDLLILALSCSAVILVGQTPLADQLRSWMEPPAQWVEPAARQPSEAMEPYGVALRNSRGLYGVLYDDTVVAQTLETVSPLVGEALSTAGTAESINDRQWQSLVESPGIYCFFQGQPPLEALSAWLGGGGTLTGGVRDLLLAWDGSQVWLGWRNGTGCYRSRTQVAYEGHLESLLEEFSPNGAAFAYTLARSDETYETLDPYVLVGMTAPQPQVYTASSPDLVGDREALEKLLSALGFQSGVESAYRAGDDLAISEGGDRLRVSGGGRVSFNAGEEARYPVASAESRPTALEAALAAWDLLNRTEAPWKGETAAFVLTGVEQQGGGWLVTFQERLGGVPLSMGEGGWCAQFTVDNRRISEFTLYLRSYTAAGTTSLVTGERLAAAALRSLPGSGGRLTLCYSDTGSGTLAAGWVAQE